MPVPAPNLYPPFNVLRFSHVVLTVTDLARSREFYAGLLGLDVADATADQVFLHAPGARDHHGIVLEAGTSASAACLGFRTFDEADLPRAKAHLVGKGFLARWVDRPHQGRTLAFQDNQGIPVELHHKATRREVDTAGGWARIGDRPVSVSHVGLASTRVDDSVAFYADLGFRVSEYVEDIASRRLWAAWMSRGGAGGGMVFLNGRGPRFHHLALRMATPLGILDRLDLIAANGHAEQLEWGPGRHGPTGAIFAYLRDPDGHRIAFTCSEQPVGDPDQSPIKWETGDPRRLTTWGAAAPDEWFADGSAFRDTDVAEPDLPVPSTASHDAL